MSTIVFKVRQGETEFVSGASVSQSMNQPEVELIAHTADGANPRRKVDVDIYMLNAGRIGAVRVFTYGKGEATPVPVDIPLPAASSALCADLKLTATKAIAYLPVK